MPVPNQPTAPGRSKPLTAWQRNALIGVATLVLQVPLFGWFWADLGGGTDRALREPTKRRVLRGQVVRRTPPKKEEKEQELPDDAQIVEVTQEPVPEPKEKVETKYLADRTTRTEEQTKSRDKSRPDKSRTAGRVKVKKRSQVQSRDSKSAEQTKLDDKDKQLALLQKRDKLKESDTGRKPQKSILHHGDKAKLFLPSTSGKAEKHNLQAASGSMATDDVLQDIKKTSDQTALNADKYKFSDFFYRVKDAVRRKWHPNDVYRRRDPTGKLYGVKDRHTVLRVTLDAKGRLKKLVTRKHSGLDFMDAEARSAFKKAQPFPNPPQGLIRGGVVQFDFGFYFEISSGRTRLWRRRL